jgi:hypothetical protein
VANISQVVVAATKAGYLLDFRRPRVSTPACIRAALRGLLLGGGMAQIAKFLGAVALSIVCMPAAFAADMSLKAAPGPVVIGHNWTGFYIGGNVGYGNVPLFVEHCEAVAAEIDVTRRWPGE